MYSTISTYNMISNQISYRLAGTSITSDKRLLINETLSEEGAISIVATFSDAGNQP